MWETPPEDPRIARLTERLRQAEAMIVQLCGERDKLGDALYCITGPRSSVPS